MLRAVLALILMGTVWVVGVAIALRHLDVGEELTVIERELRAQQLARIVGVAFLVTQIAAQLRFANR